MNYTHSKLLSCLSLCLPLFVGCSGDDNGPSNPTGSGGNSTGSGSGGSASGGSATGGGASGGAASGGSASGSASSGGSATGGGPGSGGGVGSGGDGAASGGITGSGGDSSTGDAELSDGCGEVDGAEAITAGGQSVSGGLATSTRLSIDAGSSSGEYIIDIPADYDPSKPYRLIFAWHQAYGSANGNAVGQYPANNGPNFDAEHYAFFGLHRESMEANDPVIFVAPQGIGNFPWDYDRDVVLFDNVLTKVGENLCIDKSRVFTTGFSFGAMMSHALSIGRASKLRGAVTMAPANYNFTQPPNDASTIAYFGITGMSDGTCKWVNSESGKTGGKYCVQEHAEENGCTIPGNFDTAANGTNQHVCYDYEGCDEGYPVKVCTFDGAHTPSSISGGMSGDDGLLAFVPPLAWTFISEL